MADYDLPAYFNYVYKRNRTKKCIILDTVKELFRCNIALSKRNSVVEELMDKYFAFGPVAYIASEYKIQT
jgi:hypothetical protein